MKETLGDKQDYDRKTVTKLDSFLGHPLGKIGLVVGLLSCAILLCSLCATVVVQGQTLVVLQFGNPVRVLSDPGLYFNFPAPINRVQVFDNRLFLLEPRPSEFLTSDKKNLILDSAICYSIKDPVQFMQTVRDKQNLEVRLTDLLSSHTGLLLGVNRLSDIVNTDAEQIKFEQMNAELTGLMQEEGNKLGIEVSQIFIKRVMLPDENVTAVYERMRSERERIARKYRAEGGEISLKIRSEAQKVSREIIADAERRAAIKRGQAEAQAMKIYGETYQNNVEFYSYLRSLEAYKKMFNDRSVIVLDEKSAILKTLFSGDNHAGQ